MKESPPNLWTMALIFVVGVVALAVLTAGCVVGGNFWLRVVLP